MDTANSVFTTDKKEINKTSNLVIIIFFTVMIALLIYGAITRIAEDSAEVKYAESALPDIDVTLNNFDNTYETLKMFNGNEVHIKYNDEYNRVKYNDKLLDNNCITLKRNYDNNEYKVTYSNSGISTNNEWTAMYYLRNIYNVPGEAVFGDSSFNPKAYYAGTKMDDAGYQHIIVYQYIGLQHFLKIEIQTSKHYYSYESMRKLIENTLCDYEVE